MSFRFTSRSTVAAASLLGLFASTGVAHAAGAPFLYLANGGAGQVQTYDASGALVSSTAGGQLFGAKGIVADGNGNVYTTSGNDIFKINPTTGAFITPTGSRTPFATDPNNDGEIYGLALDANNNLYFSSETTGRVYKVTPNAAGTAGTVNATPFATGVGSPGALTFDSAGNLYVGDQGIGNGVKNGNNVFKVTPTGAVSTFATGFATTPGVQSTDVLGLAFNPAGNLIVSLDQNANGNNASNHIAQVAPNGTISAFLNPASGFFEAGDAVDSAGNVYYLSNGNNTVYKAAAGGTSSTTFINGGFTSSFGIALAPAAAPEPSQFVALGLGMLGLGALALKARKRSSLTA